MSLKYQSREIITKAICGKGRKFSTVTHTVTPPHKPSSILGAWIINHQYEAVAAGDGIEVIGTYDINIWFSYDKNSQTSVAKETLSYVEIVPLSFLDPRHITNTVEVSATATQEPSTVEANISGDGSVLIRVEREFTVQLVAETKINVLVVPGGDHEDKDFEFGDDGDYEELDPDLFDEEL